MYIHVTKKIIFAPIINKEHSYSIYRNREPYVYPVFRISLFVKFIHKSLKYFLWIMLLTWMWTYVASKFYPIYAVFMVSRGALWAGVYCDFLTYPRMTIQIPNNLFKEQAMKIHIYQINHILLKHHLHIWLQNILWVCDIELTKSVIIKLSRTKDNNVGHGMEQMLLNKAK